MIALFLIAALQITPAWANSLEMYGWSFLAVSDDQELVVFYKPGPRNNTVWVRYENKAQSQSGYFSATSLVENNCSTSQSRSLQYISYTGRNLSGRSVSSSTPNNWSYPAPGTIGESTWKITCR